MSSSATSTSAAGSTPAVGVAGERLHGLDTLRAVALGLGIVLHSLMPFLPDVPWLFNDSHSSPIAHVLVDWIHLFRMVLFMALAGYFGRMVLQRRGAVSYLKDRLLRIALPAVAFWPLAVASMGVILGIGMELRGQQPPPLPVEAGQPGLLLLFSPGHLWFLWVLIEAVLITVILRAILLRVLGETRGARWSEQVGQLLSSRWGVLAAVPPYLACLLMQGSTLGGIREPTTLIPSGTALTAYLGAFLVGWFLHARAGSLHRISRHWPLHLTLAVVLTAATLLMSDSATPLLLMGAPMALAGWTWTFALIGLSVRFLHRESPVMRYVADASYWSYLLHLPVVLAIGLALADAGLPIIVKLLITWAACAAVLLVSYDLVVRSTWIGKWLNGHRRSRAWGRIGRSRTNRRHLDNA